MPDTQGFPRKFQAPAFKQDDRPVKSRRSVDAAADRAGSTAVRARSGGRCEVVTVGSDWRAQVIASLETGRHPDGWCIRRAVHVHHMIGGRWKRGIGISALAEHKQHVCDSCHRDITGDVGGRKLLRLGRQVPMWTDRYKRVR